MSKNRNRNNNQQTTMTNPNQQASQEESQKEQLDQNTAGEGNESQDQAGQENQSSEQNSEQQASDVQEQASTQAPEQQDPAQKDENTSTSDSKTKQEGFQPVYKVELDLANYAEAMDKKKVINPEEGGKWQYSLFTTIKSILNAKDQEEFNKEWNTLLMFFNKNKDGIFNENFIYRFPEQWPGSTNEFTIFRRVIFVILQTADVKGRKKALESLNLGKVAEGMTEAQKNKLFNFYGV